MIEIFYFLGDVGNFFFSAEKTMIYLRFLWAALVERGCSRSSGRSCDWKGKGLETKISLGVVRVRVV